MTSSTMRVRSGTSPDFLFDRLSEAIHRFQRFADSDFNSEQRREAKIKSIDELVTALEDRLIAGLPSGEAANFASLASLAALCLGRLDEHLGATVESEVYASSARTFGEVGLLAQRYRQKLAESSPVSFHGQLGPTVEQK